MNLNVLGIAVLGALISGFPLFLSRRRGELTPRDRYIAIHGAFASVALALMLFAFEPGSVIGNAEFGAMVIIVASGAMMFSARRKAKQLPPSLLWVHLAACAGLCIAVMS